MKKSFLPLPVPWMCASGMGEISSGLSASHLYSGGKGEDVSWVAGLAYKRVGP